MSRRASETVSYCTFSLQGSLSPDLEEHFCMNAQSLAFETTEICEAHLVLLPRASNSVGVAKIITRANKRQ
jgi:hypothetical protein